MKKFVILLFIIALAVGGLGFWYVYRSNGSAGQFRVVELRRGDLQATISATGTIQPEDVVDVGAQVAGQIEKFGIDRTPGLLNRGKQRKVAGAVAGAGAVAALADQRKPVDFNSEVEPGDVLAQIDDRIYQARVEQSQARVNSANRKVDQAKAKVDQADANVKRAEADLKLNEAKYVQADRDWERMQNLRGTQAVAPTDFDAAQAAYATAKASVGVSKAALVQAKAGVIDAKAGVEDAQAAVKDAEAALKQDQQNLDYTTIRSPIKGVVIARRVTLGQTVQSSFNAPSLFFLARDLKRLKVWVSVNEADLGSVRAGQKVKFTVDAYPHDVFEGTVDRIRKDATMSQNVVTYTVEVLTDNPVGKDGELVLVPYQTANAQFQVDERKNVLLVPNAALRWRPQPQQVAPDYRSEYEQAQRNREAAKAGGAPPLRKERNRGMVWVEENGFVRPVLVQTGLTDGTITEIVKVIKGELVENESQLVVAEQVKGGGDKATNPFAPQPFSGRK
ncbi:MAG: efflux RND transporter periplasmic adaptor subunit [Planctomycetes bacterium]|nr:efflux RND transporter periplasmic adaptor subunit [Planctomycetota bacterium]